MRSASMWGPRSLLEDVIEQEHGQREDSQRVMIPISAGLTHRTGSPSPLCPNGLPEPEIYAMPATQGQVRFWSLDQLNRGNPALNMPLMWQCTGHLDIAALTEAFAHCVERHEMLRTTFELVHGRLSQIIHSGSSVPIPIVDLTDRTGESQRIEADRVTRDHAAFRFDLQAGPLLVLKLLKLSPQHHILLVTIHHIICDGISNGVLMRDMVEWYRALVNDSVPVLPDLPIQFADYAVWHEDWRAGEEPAASVEFWHKTLGNGFSPIKLTHDPDAAAVLTPERAQLTGDIETLLIPQDLTARAHAFCIRENVTLNMLLFSVFCALLSRITGQKDLTIGSPCANRNEDTEDLIGLFMNIQVLRARLERHSTFSQLLQQVKTWCLGAYENQALPFEDLIYDPYFSESGSSFEIPIFFLYQKSFMLTGHIHGPGGDLEIVPLRSESPGAVFEIMLAIVDREAEGPRLQLEYNPQYFKSTTIQRYLRLFLNLLDSALIAPNTRVEDLSLLSALERSNSIPEPTFLPSPSEPVKSNGVEASAAIDLHMPAGITDEPADAIEQQITELWQSTLGIASISKHASFFSLGVGSLAALRLITKMNRVYDMDLGLASLISASTIASIAELVRSRFAPNTASSLVPIQPAGSKPPLFIVHGVGGNVVNFYGLSMRMGTDQPVYGVQSQALVGGQAALIRLKDMAALYLTDIRKVQPHGPYQFLGYSFGGTVVLEMAHQLQAAGETVALLGMLDSKTIHYEQERSKARSVHSKVNHRVQRFSGNIGSLTFKARAAYIWDKISTRAIRYACMIAAKLSLTQIPAFMKSAYDINYVAIQNYKLQPYNGHLVLFRALEQDFDEGAYDLGWSSIFSQGIEVHDLPGDHDRIFLEPNIEVLASSLRAALAQAKTSA